MFKKTLLILLLIFLSIISLTTLGLAETKFIIKPMFTVSGQMESNFYKAPSNEREVYTYLLQPGIQLGFETPKSKVLLNYTMEAYFYDDKSDVPEGADPADDENYVGHLLIFNANYALTRRATLGLRDSFYRTRTAGVYDELTNYVISDSVERRKYDINRFTPLIFIDFENRFSLGLRYRRTDRWFADTDIDDFTEHRGIFNLLYNPTRTITLDLDYQRWAVEYDDILSGSEYTSDQIKLLLQKRYKYFSFEAGIGYHNRDFNDRDAEDVDDVNYRLAITWQNPPIPETTRFLGDYFIRARNHIHFAFEQNFNNLGYFYDYYTCDRYTMSVGHVFYEKILARLKGYYQISDYRSPGIREDDRYDVSASIGYLISERMTLSFEAGKEQRDSNIDSYDYVDKYVMVKFDFNYDIGSRGEYSEEGLYY
jgi:hypothetical protein